MAVNIGPRIGIEGENEYRKSLNNIIQSTKMLESQMKALESSFDKNTSSQEKAAKRSELLKKAIEEQAKQLEKSKEMLEKSKELYGENDTRTQKWAKSIADCETRINLLNQELADNSALKAWGEDVQKAGESIQNVGNKIGNAGKALTKSVTMPIVAAAGASLKLAAGFDETMSKVQAVSGATTEEMVELSAAARSMGETSVFSASEAAQALVYMSMAGWDAKQMVGGLSGVINLAAASGEDLATTSDIVTDALTAFGLKAEDSKHFADVLATASSRANTNVSMMGETFKYVAPVAGSLGYSIEDTAIAIGLMANSGIKASQAGTALRGLLNRMAKQPKEAAAAMDYLGLSLDDGAGHMKSFREVMDDLRLAFKDVKMDPEEFQGAVADLDDQLAKGTITEKQYAKEIEKIMSNATGAEGALKAQYAAMLAGTNGMSGLMAIVNASDEDYEKLASSIDHCNDACERMASVMTDNLAGQMKLLKSEAEEVGISFGTVMMPYARKAVSGLSDVVKRFSEMTEAEQMATIKAAAFAAAMGPVLSVTGKAVTGFGSMVSGLGKMAVKLEEAGGLTAALTSTGAVASGLGVAIAATAAGAAYYLSTLENATPDQLKLQKALEGLDGQIKQTTSGLDTLTQNIASVADTNATFVSMDYWRDQLLECFDATGMLKEGMEGVANTALEHLNSAMQEDYSLEFIQQADDVVAALQEISGAVEDTIGEMQRQAINEAFTRDYADTIREQANANRDLAAARAEATTAEEQYKAAVANYNQQKAIYDSSEDKIWFKGLEEASRQVETAKQSLSDANNALVEAEGNASKADAAMAGLTEAMEMMSQACNADEVNAAAEAYANVATSAEEWGERAQQAALNSLTSFEELQNEVLQPPTMEEPDYTPQAKAAFDKMVTFNKSQILAPPNMDDIDVAPTVENALTTIQSGLNTDVDAPQLNDIDNAESVAGNAVGEIQSYFDKHPLSITVQAEVEYPEDAKSDGKKADHNARGGFITHEELTWVGENNKPEVIIPLAESERGRAIDLFKQTSAILGTSANTYNEDSLVSGIGQAVGQANANTNVTVVLQGDAAGVFKLVQKQNSFNRRAGRAEV